MFLLMVDRPRARVGLGLNCYVIVFKSFQIYPDKASTWRRLASVFKFIHSGERFQIYPFSVCENAVYVWTEPVTV